MECRTGRGGGGLGEWVSLMQAAVVPIFGAEVCNAVG